ncbi:hypothetical protein [Aureimonas sp. Leaf324]|uniref:hypothetical protein n=1 Tax=Aureimonas sp. Leaf324 TaxID=1736336 RepID=UPI0006FFE723|nr:hypothetical protein [Aureimonas sp. Leaf324]KQQ85618.1 hypothetical protein ASF65_03420 [Aureimonas sp. Leaf324]
MSYSYSNPQNRIRARKLRNLLLSRVDEAMADIARSDTVSKVGENALRYYDLESVEGVHVYRSSGGWCADLVFAGLPTGIPTVVGTPDGMEAATTAEAIANGLSMMALVKLASQTRIADVEEIAIFSMDGVELSFPIRSLDTALAYNAFEDLPTVEFALERLAQVSMLMTAGERRVTRADIDALAPDDRRSFDAVCAQALVLGIPRYLSPGMTIAPPPPTLM